MKERDGPTGSPRLARQASIRASRQGPLCRGPRVAVHTPRSSAAVGRSLKTFGGTFQTQTAAQCEIVGGSQQNEDVPLRPAARDVHAHRRAEPDRQDPRPLRLHTRRAGNAAPAARWPGPGGPRPLRTAGPLPGAVHGDAAHRSHPCAQNARFLGRQCRVQNTHVSSMRMKYL